MIKNAIRRCKKALNVVFMHHGFGGIPADGSGFIDHGFRSLEIPLQSMLGASFRN